MNFATGDQVERLSDGQRGRIVSHDGRPMVRLDRGKVECYEELSPQRWRLAPGRAPIVGAQLARIQYAAVLELRRARGEYGVKGWDTLRDGDRATFTASPPAEPEQKALWEAVRDALGGEA